MGDTFTCGELFADGSAIELVRGEQLLLWTNGCETIAPSIDWSGATYRPAKLDAHLLRALDLPAASADYGTPESLIANLSAETRDCLGVDDDQAILISTFTRGTWVGECLSSGGLVLNLWGPAGTERAALDFTAAISRRALRLLEPSPADIAALPLGLEPTIILHDPKGSSLRKLLAVAGGNGVHLLRGGRLLSVQCSIVIYTQSPIPGVALSIPLPTMVRSRRFTARDTEDLRQRFQPLLLRFRLDRHTTISNSQFDVEGFAPATQRLARQLGAVLEGAPAMQMRMFEALKPLDEQWKAQQSQDTVAAVIEACLVGCHEGSSLMYVREVTEIAKTILLARNESSTLTPKSAGAVLRDNVGVVTHRKGPGYRFQLDGATCQRIHELGKAYGVLSLVEPRANCAFCSAVFGGRSPN